MRNAVLNENDELRSNTLLAGPEWKESKIMWRHYTQSISNAVVADDNDEYTPSETKNARNLVLETTNGNLIEFLDKYEETTERHAYHRHLVSTERKASIEYDQNIRPLMVTRNQDFAENGSIKNKRQVQSQYWITISYTLFISCVSWLQSSEWNNETGKLVIGDEVTVHGEKAGEPINLDSFYGCVTGVVSELEYEVTDNDGMKHNLHRKDVRLRKCHNVVFGHVSEDKSHDTYAMQHYTNNELTQLEKYMAEHFRTISPMGRLNVSIQNQIMQLRILRVGNQ